MGAWGALLDPADVQGGRAEVHLIPAQVHQLGDAEAMPVAHQDHGGVPVAPAVAVGCCHQPLDLSFREVLAGAQDGVRHTPRGNCAIYGGWRDQLEVRLVHGFRLSRADDCSYKTSSTNCRVGQD